MSTNQFSSFYLLMERKLKGHPPASFQDSLASSHLTLLPQLPWPLPVKLGLAGCKLVKIGSHRWLLMQHSTQVSMECCFNKYSLITGSKVAHYDSKSYSGYKIELFSSPTTSCASTTSQGQGSYPDTCASH